MTKIPHRPNMRFHHFHHDSPVITKTAEPESEDRRSLTIVGVRGGLTRSRAAETSEDTRKARVGAILQ